MASTESLLQLGRELAAEQDAALAQDLSLGAVRARMGGHSARQRRPRARWLAFAATFSLASALALWFARRTQAPLEASLGGRALAVGEWVSASEPGAPPIRFSDGAQVELSQGSRARLATLDSVGAHLVLESGSLDVQVPPNHGARYRLSLGPFAVDVTGTRFDVGFRPSDEVFTLTLREGKVMVSGCMLGEGRMLLAGEALKASCRTGQFEISALAASKPEGAPNAPDAVAEGAAQAQGAAPIEPQTPPAADAPHEAAPIAPSWQSLAKQGRFDDAYAAIGEGGFDTAVAKASSPELSLLGDTARFAGKPAAALSAYQALRARAGGSAAAKQAAFSIARVHFDQRAAYAEAARWFRIYLAEQPQGPFAREAEGRLIEALSRSGDSSGAQRAAEGYLAKYPNGAHARVARQVLAR
jgi:hypothetical protein